MLFVADQIPSELRRIVEFLNEQMDPAEVLAIEIRQFIGEGQKILVPRVIGQTAEAERKKSVSGTKQWDESTFFTALTEQQGQSKADIVRRILAWSKERFPRIRWGTGPLNPSFMPVLPAGNFKYLPFAVYLDGSFEVRFQYLRDRPPFDCEDMRKELLRRLNAIPEVALPKNSIDRRPSIPLFALEELKAIEQLLHVMEWAIEVISSSTSVDSDSFKGNPAK
jgi:hypothetical protein